MLIEKIKREHVEEIGCKGGNGKLSLDMLYSGAKLPSNVKVFAKATLVPGDSIGYHTHTGESETYFILSGCGTYNDNGKTFPVKAGDVTVTYSGEGHSIENTGNSDLEFIALIIFD